MRQGKKSYAKAENIIAHRAIKFRELAGHQGNRQRTGDTEQADEEAADDTEGAV